jgi:hypothetical protein
MGWPTASVSGLLVLIVSFAARADPRIVPIRGRDATPAFDFPRTVADAASRARSACLGAIDAAGNLISWEGDDPARPRRSYTWDICLALGAFLGSGEPEAAIRPLADSLVRRQDSSSGFVVCVGCGDARPGATESACATGVLAEYDWSDVRAVTFAIPGSDLQRGNTNGHLVLKSFEALALEGSVDKEGQCR